MFGGTWTTKSAISLCDNNPARSIAYSCSLSRSLLQVPSVFPTLPRSPLFVSLSSATISFGLPLSQPLYPLDFSISILPPPSLFVCWATVYYVNSSSLQPSFLCTTRWLCRQIHPGKKRHLQVLPAITLHGCLGLGSEGMSPGYYMPWCISLRAGVVPCKW